MKRKLNLVLSALMATALAVGGTQAIGAQSALRETSCSEPGNWCAGGDEYCNACCNAITGSGLGGFCVSYEPGQAQGCLCY